MGQKLRSKKVQDTFFGVTIVYLRENSKIKDTFFQKNIFFDSKMGDWLAWICLWICGIALQLCFLSPPDTFLFILLGSKWVWSVFVYILLTLSLQWWVMWQQCLLLPQLFLQMIWEDQTLFSAILKKDIRIIIAFCKCIWKMAALDV